MVVNFGNRLQSRLMISPYLILPKKAGKNWLRFSLWTENAQLLRHPVYMCTLTYLRSYIGTDTLRGDVDGDVPQDVLLNPENGEMEARRPFSRVYLYVCMCTCGHMCATLHVELERSGVQAGWRGTDGAAP